MNDENTAPNSLLSSVAETPEENRSKAKSSVEIVKAAASNTNSETAGTAKVSPIHQSEHQHSQDNYESEEEEEEEEYHHINPSRDVRELLESIAEPGNFVVSGICGPEMTMPGLFVDGIGLIGLPLSNDVAEQLSKRCEQAPFGRGPDTLVDTTIRNTKQLGPQSFSLQNPQWRIYIESLTDTVAKGLGVQDYIQVEAELYKLLLYEKGSFFTKHRDSEKTPGMFGTLVVVLPSQFKGGQLVVDHKQKHVDICQEANSAFSAQYAAFYADCRHELKQVTEGHRLCLVYNLVKKGGPGPRPSLSESMLLKQLRSAAKAWAKEYDGNDKLVIMTDHLYTPAGMSEETGSSKYKGKDAALINLLDRAQEFGVDICYEQGTLFYSESGYAEDNGDYYSDDYEWMETTETHLALTLLNNVQLSVISEEIVPEDYLDNAELIDETFEPTGNEGVNAEREYSDKGAIVVFPKSKRWATLADYDGNKMSRTLLSNCSGSYPRESLIEQANATIDCFSQEPRVGINSFRKKKENWETLKNLIKSLHRIGDEIVIKYFTEKCSGLNSFRAQVEDFDYFQRYAAIIEAAFFKALPALYKSTPNEVISFAVNFATKNNDGDDASRKELMARLSAKIVTNVVAAMQPNVLGDSTMLSDSLKTENVKSFLSLFLQSPPSPAISNLDCPKLVHDFITAVTWASCQKVNDVGPVSLVNTGIRDICLKYGWQQFEQAISDAVQKLRENRNIPHGIMLADEIVFPLAPQGLQSEQHRACAVVASQILTERCLNFVQQEIRDGRGTHHSVVLRFFALCDAFKPDFLSQLVPAVNAVDDQKGAQLVLLLAKRKYRSDQGKKALEDLALKSAENISVEATEAVHEVKTWQLPVNTTIPDGLPKDVIKFLRSPCEQTLSYRLAKKDHNGLTALLGSFIQAKVLKVSSHQPTGNYWHVKLEKLQQRLMRATEASGCNCVTRSSSFAYANAPSFGSGYSFGQSYSQERTCLFASIKPKLESQRKAIALLNQLLPHLSAEARSDFRKRKGLPQPTKALSRKKAKESVDVVDLT